ncbi:MAG: YabP/YqfC family sporulation protein, partial [Clostridia bacterium]|nr:YabP/YqfC family sporulation protein [Clostridia bacterium]
LDYNENCVKINTTTGIIKIDGDELFIESTTDEGAFIRGRIIRVEFI